MRDLSCFVKSPNCPHIRPLCERRDILLQNMTEVRHRVQFSEMKEIHKPVHLREMIARVLSEGLEGLVLKDIKSIYEPGKRHWLKVSVTRDL